MKSVKLAFSFAFVCFIAIGMVFAKKNDNKPAYQETGLEMRIGEADSSIVELKHFAPAEIATWNVLLVDSYNTQRTIDYLNASAEIMIKFKNKYAADDCDWNQINMLQKTRLNKFFKNVRTEYKEGEKYDLIIIRDCIVNLGPKAGQMTSMDLKYWFVYKVDPEKMAVTGNLEYAYRGVYSAKKSKAMESGFSFELQNVNKACIDDLNYLLEGGLDILTWNK